MATGLYTPTSVQSQLTVTLWKASRREVAAATSCAVGASAEGLRPVVGKASQLAEAESEYHGQQLPTL